MSIPSQVTVKPSSRPGAGLGVFAQQMIPRGVKVGPYVGRKVPVGEVEEDTDTSYMWEVYIILYRIIIISLEQIITPHTHVQQGVKQLC